MKTIITDVRQALQSMSDEKTKQSGQTFFKEKIKLYGVKSAIVSQIGKNRFHQIKDLEKAEIFRLCEELWKSGYMEESFIACNWSYLLRKSFLPSDISVFEKWIEYYVTNWASCDTFCNHTVGALLEMYPKTLPTLNVWAVSSNRWMRRAAAVSLIVPARKGLFSPEIFQIADILLLDSDDMVQKGYGWMLKVASQTSMEPVFDYVMMHKAVMPRTALRYAIEKMPLTLRKEALVRES